MTTVDGQWYEPVWFTTDSLAVKIVGTDSELVAYVAPSWNVLELC